MRLSGHGCSFVFLVLPGTGFQDGDGVPAVLIGSGAGFPVQEARLAPAGGSLAGTLAATSGRTGGSPPLPACRVSRSSSAVLRAIRSPIVACPTGLQARTMVTATAPRM